MSKIIFIGHSVVKGVGYGGVTAVDSFAHKIGIANGYVAADILNKGVSSDTSAGVLARLDADVIANEPSVCAVMLGVNDWSTGVPVSTFKQNFLSIVDAVKSAGIKCVVFTDNAYRGTSAQFSSYYQYIEAIREVAFLKDCCLVDLYGRMLQRMIVGDHAILYSDNIHLSVAGHQFVADHAAKSFHGGFFLADPDEQPPPGPVGESPLLMAVVNYILATGNPSLTASVSDELAEVIQQ